MKPKFKFCLPVAIAYGLWFSGVVYLITVAFSPKFDTDAPVCVNPVVRREWRSFTVEEKTAWVSAINCIASKPHNTSLSPIVPLSVSQIPPVNTSTSLYDDIVYMHMDLNTRVHYTGFFFPWHRWFVHSFENLLKSECGYTGSSPYWNWSADASDIYGSTLLQEPNKTSGIGGWGDPTIDNAVTSGAFNQLSLGYPSPHILRRKFTLQPYLTLADDGFYKDDYALLANTTFTTEEVSKMINGFVGDFKGIQTYLEKFNGSHSAVHNILGGDLSSQCPDDAPPNCTSGAKWSANEPIFWMHHAMIDKIWYDWQHKDPANFWAYEGGTTQKIDTLADYLEWTNGAPPNVNMGSSLPNDGIFERATVSDVFNTTGGYLCYVYDS